MLTESEDALIAKVGWAVKELSGTSSVECSIQLCVLIRQAVEALKGVRELHTGMDST